MTTPCREHVFNLLALVLEREPVHIAARAFDSDDMYLRGTALEYLETVLPPGSSRRWLRDSQPAPAPVLRKRGLAMVRAELLDAGGHDPREPQQILQELSRPRSRRRRLGR